MNLRLLILLLIPAQTLTAQTFTQKIGTPFEGVRTGAIAFSDVNGDGQDDVLITGENNSMKPVAKLYMNSGGIFTEKTDTPFDGVSRSAVAFSDVNGDGYDDVLIAGRDTSFGPNTKLYTNDGTGNFTEIANTPFDSTYSGSIAFSDVNGDGYSDVLLSGVNKSLKYIAKLYTNDGTGTFTEVTGTPFEGVWHSSIAFSEVNGDGHQDVLIAGVNISGILTTKLYTNDGTGTFTEVTDTPFTAVVYSAIVFSDVNGDGYDDVLISGENSSQTRTTKLYTNDGTGTFTEILDTPFEGTFFSTINFSDVNNDSYNDVIITGVSSSDFIITKLYANDGSGTFTEITDTPFDGVWSGSVAFSDVNSDGFVDVLITGKSPGDHIAKLYMNNESSPIKDLSPRLSLHLGLSPNPSNSPTLLLHYNSPEKSEVTIKVYDTNGSLQFQQKENTIRGEQTFSLDISTLPKGSYFLELDNGTRKGSVQFIVH